jgi:general secretion pathway protein G
MWERMQEKRNEGGFTLIELLIVIIILAILAAIVVFAVGTTGKNASAASCEADAKSVETAVEAYKAGPTAVYPAADAWTGATGLVPNYLRQQPGTTHYVINFDNAGHISADKVGVAAYTAADDIDGTGGASAPCNANAV